MFWYDQFQKLWVVWLMRHTRVHIDLKFTLKWDIKPVPNHSILLKYPYRVWWLRAVYRQGDWILYSGILYFCVLSTELASRHPSNIYNLGAPRRILENFLEPSCTTFNTRQWINYMKQMIPNALWPRTSPTSSSRVTSCLRSHQKRHYVFQSLPCQSKERKRKQFWKLNSVGPQHGSCLSSFRRPEFWGVPKFFENLWTSALTF